jgi:hypothetical protein
MINMIETGWVAEKANYHGRVTGFNPGEPVNGHYTQMVWNTTKEVGCAIAKSTVGGESRGTRTGELWSYLVCRYKPAGNYGPKAY